MKKIAVILEKNEERVIPFFWRDGDETDVLVEVRLRGEGSSATIVGGFYGTSSRELIFNTRVIHEAPKTKSLTVLRGVFEDSASFSNDGMITITKGAAGSDGYFASKILLFDDAKGKSIPSLEIDENDLKAGHASTVGRPDEEQLFYLRSRGLSEEKAIRLIVSGFFEPLFSYLPKLEKHKARQNFHYQVT